MVLHKNTIVNAHYKNAAWFLIISTESVLQYWLNSIVVEKIVLLLFMNREVVPGIYAIWRTSMSRISTGL